MANFLTNNLRIKSEEQKQIVMMLCTGFFMGVFLATYQVTADSLFLNRIRFTTLALSSVLLIFLFTISAFWLLRYGNPAWHNEFVFALYCMTGPITAVLLLSFWGIFGRLFNFRQSKRIIGWIDTGQLIAAILATLVFIPFTSKLISDTTNYLLVCAISIAAVSVLMLTIASSFTLSKNDPREFGVAIRRETRLVKLFGD